MSQKEIIDQVKQLQAQGKSRDFINKSLEAGGWSKAAVTRAFGEINKKQPLIQGQAGPQQPGFQNLTAEQVKFIKSWSWAAFFGSIIWVLGNRLYNWALIFLLVGIIPFASLIISVYLGMSGRQLAWQKGKWSSYDEFYLRQRKLDKIILIVYGILAALLVAGVIASIAENQP
jgi:hypothetical protein